jgi:hypothetical protein
MLKIASAVALVLALGTGVSFAQENGSSGNGQNYLERCTPETVSEIADIANSLSEANPRKASLSKHAKACMVRLQAAMQRIH